MKWKTWRTKKLLPCHPYISPSQSKATIKKARGANKGTCLADCFSLLSERKRGGNHHELIVRYYRGNNRTDENVIESRLQLAAYFRKRGYEIYSSDERPPNDGRFYVLIGAVKNGYHAVIAKNRVIWFDPATFDSKSTLENRLEYVWLQKKSRKRSNDVGRIRRR